MSSFTAVLTRGKTDKINWHHVTFDVDKFVQYFMERGHPVGSKDGTGIIAGRFKKNSRLLQANMIDATGIILDFDGKSTVDGKVVMVKLDPEAILASLPFKGLAHTSFSTGPAYPRFRVILPLEAPISLADHHKLWWWLFEKTGKQADPSGKNPDRMFFLPRRPGDGSGADHWLKPLDGPLLSLAALPPGYMPPQAEYTPPATRTTAKQGLHLPPPRKGDETAEEVIAAFMESPLVAWAMGYPSDISREAWRGIATQLAALAVEFPDALELCEDAFHQISEQDEYRYRYNDCQYVFEDALQSAEKYGPITYTHLIANGAPESIKTEHSSKAPIADARKTARKLKKPLPTAEAVLKQAASIADTAAPPTPPTPTPTQQTPATPLTAPPAPAPAQAFDPLDPHNFLLCTIDGLWHVRRQQDGQYTSMTYSTLCMMLRQAPYNLEKKHIDPFLQQTDNFESFAAVIDQPYGLLMDPKTGNKLFNRYIPPTFKGVPGSWDHYYALIFNLANKDPKATEFLLDWLALPLQCIYQHRKAYKMGTAIVLQGAPGGGKGTLESILRIFYGDTNMVSLQQSQLDSKFNDIIQSKLLVIANEVMSSTNRSMETANKLKAWITDPYITVERKFREPEQISNELNIIFMSNDERPVILEKRDRRFCVFHSDKLDMSVAGHVHYDLGTVRDPGPRTGLAAFFDHLQNRKVTLKYGDLFKTAARAELIDKQLPSEEVFAAAIAEDGWLAVAAHWVQSAPPNSPREATSLDGAITMDTVLAVYKDYCSARALRLRGPILLRAAILEALHERGIKAEYVRLRINGIRPWVFTGIPLAGPADVLDIKTGEKVVPATPEPVVGGADFA